MVDEKNRKRRKKAFVEIPTDDVKTSIISDIKNLKPNNVSLSVLLSDYTEVINEAQSNGINWSQLTDVFNARLSVEFTPDQYRRAYSIIQKNNKK